MAQFHRCFHKTLVLRNIHESSPVITTKDLRTSDVVLRLFARLLVLTWLFSHIRQRSITYFIHVVQPEVLRILQEWEIKSKRATRNLVMFVGEWIWTESRRLVSRSTVEEMKASSCPVWRNMSPGEIFNPPELSACWSWDSRTASPASLTRFVSTTPSARSRPSSSWTPGGTPQGTSVSWRTCGRTIRSQHYMGVTLVI